MESSAKALSQCGALNVTKVDSIFNLSENLSNKCYKDFMMWVGSLYVNSF